MCFSKTTSLAVYLNIINLPGKIFRVRGERQNDGGRRKEERERREKEKRDFCICTAMMVGAGTVGQITELWGSTSFWRKKCRSAVCQSDRGKQRIRRRIRTSSLKMYIKRDVLGVILIFL